MWASAPTKVCYAGGPAAAPTFPGFHFRQAISRRLYVGTGAHTRPGLAGGPERWADVGIGPYKGLLRGWLLRPPLHFRGSVSGGLSHGAYVGAGAHTRPGLAGGPERRAYVGIGPYKAGLIPACPRTSPPVGGPCGRPRQGQARPYKPSSRQDPRVRRYAGRGGAPISRGGNENGKLYGALSITSVGTGGQLSPHRLQRGLRQN